MAEYKDVHSPPLVRAPQSQLTAEQTSTGRYPTSKDKEEAAMRQ